MFVRAICTSLALLATSPMLASQGCNSGPPVAAIPTPSVPAPATPTPATPSTPSPATPSTPSPSTPKTPGPATPRGNRPSTPRGGLAINFTRQSTSRAILELDWDYVLPDQIKKQRDKGRTSAPVLFRPIPVAEAFKQIAGKDRRPLLILRECHGCAGTANAVLDRRFKDKSEKTLLLARWFHCVKLPQSVLHKTHPFRKIFDEKEPSHLFLCMPDGSRKVRFNGHQPQSKLHKAMIDVIGVAYEKNPKPALKVMLKHLSTFDHCDTMLKNIRKQIMRKRYSHGPKSSQVAKLQKKVEKYKAQRAHALKMAKAVCDLKLKVEKPTGKKKAVAKKAIAKKK